MGPGGGDEHGHRGRGQDPETMEYSSSDPSKMIVLKAPSAGGNAATCLAVSTLSCTRGHGCEIRPIGLFANQALGSLTLPLALIRRICSRTMAHTAGVYSLNP